MIGTLYLVSTPIGNLEDISIRAIKTLCSVDYIACEDTRRTGFLLNELQNKYKDFCLNKKRVLISYYDEIEHKKVPEFIAYLEEGKSIALVSDSGTPLINDPGFVLVREAKKRCIPITAIPGPSAAITALILSGLPTNIFTFVGFLPETSSKRIHLLERIKTFSSTYILYCSPHKLEQTLHDIHAVFGNIDIVLARELTKLHEEIKTEPIIQLLEDIKKHPMKGECILLFQNNSGI
ncbi:MAG: 16S rRNA (cytidine(1402)-2'-O)-methyltransferase [Patescibacteria group bacterium]|nr:16S rRNA (cytidine(1402)-2'-O)-methyltransferase [Patescibacteria group bacterium]